MAPEPLSVDTERLAGAGQRFLAAANSIPDAPAPYVPEGTDALSAAIAAQAPKVMAPVAAGLPDLKASTTKFAQNVINAARAYQAANQQHAQDIGRSGAGIPQPGSGGSGTGGAAGPGASGGSAATSATSAGQMGDLSQFGQLMQMPMQMASQAAQMPMQMAGMMGVLPQSLIQGLQGPLQQLSQISQMGHKSGDGQAGEKEGETLVNTVQPADQDHSPSDDKTTAEGAAPGHTAERPPEAAPQPNTSDSAPPVQAPSSPKGAPDPEKYSVL